MFTSRQLRKKYIDFFAQHGHAEVESSSTVPHKDDQTVLFTTAGMQQFVPNLMGKPHEKGTRLSSVQKCVRTVDIDEVGDNRHLTLFEMLGNWSLGDYFKKEALEWSWKFLTEEAKIAPERIWVTVFGGDKDIPLDTDAEKIWLELGVPKERIVPIGPDPKNPKKGRGDNFWGPAGPTGPCGPCSEMHIWIGEGQPKPGQNPANDDTNFVEVWNDVFMEFYSDENGKLSKLDKQNVDTGMGLERLTMILNNKKTVFETDVYAEILAKIEKLSGQKYPPYHGDEDEKNSTTRAFRVVADHIRTATHIVADGIAPSNEGRGYVLRRLIRRAVRYGKQLGLSGTFLSHVASVYIDAYSCFYPEIAERKQVIFSTLTLEEEQFLKTLERGEKKMEEIQNEKFKMQNAKFSGADAFLLSDTYGFPKDLTRELAQEKGFEIDEETFNAEFEEELKAQRERSRANKNFDRKGSENAVFDAVLATEFLGYSEKKCEAKILKLVELDEKTIKFALDKTPFYAESGGQVADHGIIKSADGEISITDVQKRENGVFIHTGNIIRGDFAEGDTVTAEIFDMTRERIKRHHSAAHLLHSALKKVLGDHVEQAGSHVDANRTRFDFSHPKAMTTKEIAQVEQYMEEWVFAAYAVNTVEMPLDEAKKAGAEALFSEKYGATVRTIKMGTVSFELCGGTHVQNTAEIGAIKILSETSVASGIRRIELVCGIAAQELLREKFSHIATISDRLKCTPQQILERIEGLFADKKNLEAQMQDLEKLLAEKEAEEFLGRQKTLTPTLSQGERERTLICEPVATHDLKKIANIAKALSEQKISTVVLFSEDGGVVIATQKGGEDAREIFKKIQAIGGGNGGGSPFFVQGKGINLEEFPKIRQSVEGVDGVEE